MNSSRIPQIGVGVAAAVCAGAILWWHSLGDSTAPAEPPPVPNPTPLATAASNPAPEAEAPPLNERICPKTGGRGCRCGAPTPVDSPEGQRLYPYWPAASVRLLPVHTLASGLHDPSTDGVQDVEVVVTLLEKFRRVMGSMPVGELNEEIVRRLQGQNPKGVAVLPPTHPALSARGELLDRWGTPFRFHPESSALMLVRSAGPDRRMWTRDDILSEQTSLLAGVE